ncbi:MAG TPA: DUF4129 domain-containing protein [Candidatus Angelobacter sp.]|nr:DUF4129 domain-containing protein [Candidatus Angelobacter sp.]
MNYSNAIRSALLAMLVFFCAVRAHANSISVSEYRQQLADISQKVDALKADPDQAAQLVTEIPDTVSVSTGSGEVQVNYKILKADLAAFSRANEEKRASLLNQIQNYVQALTSEAEAFERAGTDLSAAHNKLAAILARHEFSKVRGPNAKDALLARIFRWLSRHLGRFRVGGKSTFDVMLFFIYLLVGTAAVFLLVWTIGRLRRPQEELPQREIIPFSPSARSWRKWLAEARALAQQQDWRNAIHLAYWAGISYLEEHGAWKPNRARTPREYLRLIGSRGAQYPVLAALTRKLEQVWYGYADAAESDFHETLGELEKLGCR